MSRYGPFTRIRLLLNGGSQCRPTASEVLSCHLRQLNKPFWTSYFVRYESVVNDQFGRSHFNWTVDDHNYHILRIGCYPFIKYHCSRRDKQDLSFEDVLFTLLKITNLGIPTLAYGLAAKWLIRVSREVRTSKGSVWIYFLNEEDINSPH